MENYLVFYHRLGVTRINGQESQTKGSGNQKIDSKAGKILDRNNSRSKFLYQQITLYQRYLIS